jgi:hypothetical protein
LHLSAFVDALSGEQARQLGEYMRSAGAVDLLAELLDDPDPLLPQWVLGTLANLCSDAFDPGSAYTKARGPPRFRIPPFPGLWSLSLHPRP